MNKPSLFTGETRRMELSLSRIRYMEDQALEKIQAKLNFGQYRVLVIKEDMSLG